MILGPDATLTERIAELQRLSKAMREAAGEKRRGLAAMVIFAGAMLTSDVQKLTDEQVARLMMDALFPDLAVFGLESCLLSAAVDRLKRAQGGPFTDAEVEATLAQGPPCPKCSKGEMFYNAPLPPGTRPYYECSQLVCKHRVYL